jgi:hypothetical protein
VDAATLPWPKGNKNLGPLVDVAVSALIAQFADYGIGKEFPEQVRSKVTEGSSLLFLLLGLVTIDRVIEAFKTAPKFELIASNLSHQRCRVEHQTRPSGGRKPLPGKTTRPRLRFAQRPFTSRRERVGWGAPYSPRIMLW